MPEDITKDDVAPAVSPASNSPKGDGHELPSDHKDEIDDAASRSHRSSVLADGDEKNDPEDLPPLSRRSTELEPAVKVPRGKRRGLAGSLALVAEIENPKTYTRKMKWFITFIVAWAGASAPMGSSIFFRKLRADDRYKCMILIESYSFAFPGDEGAQHHIYYH